MTVTKQNLVLNARETVSIKLSFKNPDGSIKVLPSGIEVIAEIVESQGNAFGGNCSLVSNSKYAVFDYEINRDMGTILLDLSAYESDKLQSFMPYLDHYWNVFLVYSNGKKIKKVEGSVTINLAAR